MMNLTDDDIIYNKHDEGSHGFSSSMLVCAAAMTFIIMIIGIFGNFLTIIALIKYPKVRNVASAFIISLCIADLLFCILVLPFNALRFIHGTWTHGDFLCKLIPFIQYGNIGVSLLCIAMITINRYIMIAYHSAYGKIYKKHWIAIMIAFCWIFSYGMQVPTLIGVWGMFGFDNKLATCSIMADSNGRSSKTSLFIIAFVIPCLIIIACYTKIFWVVHQSEMRLRKHSNEQNSIPNNLRNNDMINNQSQISSNNITDSINSIKIESAIQTQKTSHVKDKREARSKRNEWRITKMVLAIFLSFVVCYLPITIVKVADKNVQYPGLHIFSYIMLYLSACINPIIYVIMNKQYRKAYKSVIMCKSFRLFPFVGRASTGCSSGLEKWKDVALSNNQNRTIVSQMSIDEQNTSVSGSQSPPSVSLEMTSKTKINNTSLQPPKIQTVNDKKPFPEQSKQRGMTIGVINRNNANLQNAFHEDKDIPYIKNLRAISLVDPDIILEEEEEVIVSQDTLASVEPLATSQKVQFNTDAQTKSPRYGQNTNVIPGSHN